MSVEPTTLRERYSRAMSSSHLELNSNRRGDIDVIAAAGAVGMPDERRVDAAKVGYSMLPISSLLLRLTAEYDEVRGPRAIARKNFSESDSREHARSVAADAVTRETNRRARVFLEETGRRPRKDKGEAQMTSDELRECVTQAGIALRDQMAHDAKMAHAFVLMRLQSLASTKQAFGEWALVMANKRNFMDAGPMPMVDPDQSPLFAEWRQRKRAQYTVVVSLAGRILDLVLDPNCYRCEGRGFSGGYSHQPQKICNDERKGGCGGSGRRPTDKLGNSKEQSDFAAYLLMEVDIMLGRQSRRMKEKLFGPPESLAVA